jgi:hypothetical protein
MFGGIPQREMEKLRFAFIRNIATHVQYQIVNYVKKIQSNANVKPQIWVIASIGNDG